MKICWNCYQHRLVVILDDNIVDAKNHTTKITYIETTVYIDGMIEKMENFLANLFCEKFKHFQVICAIVIMWIVGLLIGGCLCNLLIHIPIFWLHTSHYLSNVPKMPKIERQTWFTNDKEPKCSFFTFYPALDKGWHTINCYMHSYDHMIDVIIRHCLSFSKYLFILSLVWSKQHFFKKVLNIPIQKYEKRKRRKVNQNLSI